MAWELCATTNVWEDVKRVLETWPAEDLAMALADYNHETFHTGHMRKGNPHHRGAWDYRKLLHLPRDILVGACMDAMWRVHTTDNGGHRVWIDPDGWHGVTLPE